MKELIIAVGLLFFLEGLFLAIFPSRIKSILELIKSTPESKLRLIGVVFLIIGFLIILYLKKKIKIIKKIIRILIFSSF